MAKEMTKKGHIARHKVLHKHFDELAADFIAKTGKTPSKSTILELMQWSHRQTIKPTVENAPLEAFTQEKPMAKDIEDVDIVRNSISEILDDEGGFEVIIRALILEVSERHTKQNIRIKTVLATLGQLLKIGKGL